MTSVRVGWSSLLLTCLGCVEPGADRAERDAHVGQASRAGLDVEVAGGLAAVRGLDETRLHLWENAPSLELRIESEQVPRSFELLVENCMPQAVLSIRRGQATFEAKPRERPTACRFELRLESSVSELRLADPVADDLGPFHFGVMSDVQDGIERIGEMYARINEEPQIAFMIATGDLTVDGTVAQLEQFQSEMKSLNVPYYVTLGNHELRVSPPPYHDYFGRGSSSFLFREVRFTLLDAANATLDSHVYDWLGDWLDLGQSNVHVVAMHVPPFDPTGRRNGSFSNRTEAAALLGKLASGGVDLTLYGHIHTYHHFTNAGIDAHISGGGGADPSNRHFLDVAVDANGIQDVRVVRVDQ